MISAILSRLVILLFGTLYPAYASYKAVRTKNVKEYVKWMMYWIVFALFTCVETFTDMFLSFWFPFYYEIKIVLVIWLLSPATKGSSILYRNFVHPALTKREQEIDEYISKAKEQGYHTMLHLGSRGVTYATNVIMQTAIKGGGGIVNHLRRSYSLSDLSDDTDHIADLNRNSKLHGDAVDSADVPRDPRIRSQRKPVGSHVDLYFPEMDVDLRSHPHHPHELPTPLSQIRSTEDISSGYSSAEPLYGEGQVMPEGNPLMRTASVGATRARARGGRAAALPKKALTTEGRGEDYSDDFGWPHALPPIPITTLFPELLDLDPSALPREAFLSPEALQLIYTNAMYRDQRPPNIYEMVEEETVKLSNSSIKESDKLLENSEQENQSKSIDTVTEQNKIISDQKDETNYEKKIDNPETTFLDNDSSNEQKEKTENPNALKPDSALPDDISVGDNIKTENSEETQVITVTDDTSSKQATSETVNETLENSPKEEIEQNIECFEDASDAEILTESVISESLKPTVSMESVASSDLCFEDSMPDVIMVAGRDSPGFNERKGKYKKGRAPPPPPDVTKGVESEQASEDNQNPQDSNVTSATAVLPIPSDELKSVSEVRIQDRERLSISSVQEKRDVSPTPSQRKKDNSSFSRFLPKTGMTSLFNLWGPKDNSQKSNTNLSRSPSNVSVSSLSSGKYRPTPSSISVSNIEYNPDNNEHVSRNEENEGRSTPKLRLRQMSQSPSRRKHHNYE